MPLPRYIIVNIGNKSHKIDVDIHKQLKDLWTSYNDNGLLSLKARGLPMRDIFSEMQFTSREVRKLDDQIRALKDNVPTPEHLRYQITALYRQFMPELMKMKHFFSMYPFSSHSSIDILKREIDDLEELLVWLLRYK